ncbi:MAG: TraB/GumN family protein [Desulfobacterales bacterium]|nr:TraB/GumN family protein [Desulfobacterales bacterium]
MFFRRSKERELKMIWEVVKDGNISHLIGTAHFFPYSFKTSLSNCLESSRVVVFEGPLDADNMARVVNRGIDCQSTYHIFNDLDRKTIDRITHKVAPKCRDKDKFMIFNLRKFSIENPVYEMVRGMKPWLAFFTIWSNYLQKNGWKYSVDLEGHKIAGQLSKKIVYLETIEEQIQVLENLSRDRIIEFLKQVEHWQELAREYAECYLAADLENLKSKGLRFPSRHYSVIDHRDRIFYERMLEHVNNGNAAIFVGAPHVLGISKYLRRDGFGIIGPPIPDDPPSP